MAPRSHERFSRIPVSIDEAIQREELSPHRGELLKRLIFRCGARHETEFTLAELREFLRDKRKVEALRRDLVALEKAGWTDLDRSAGHGQNVWRLRLTAAARGIGEELNSSEVGAPEPGTQDGDTESAAYEFLAPEIASSPQITDTDRSNPQACADSEEESRRAAERLVDAIRPERRDRGTRSVVVKYVQEGLHAADFDSVRLGLGQHRDEIRNEGKWVNGALRKIAVKRAAERRAAA